MYVCMCMSLALVCVCLSLYLSLSLSLSIYIYTHQISTVIQHGAARQNSIHHNTNQYSTLQHSAFRTLYRIMSTEIAIHAVHDVHAHFQACPVAICCRRNITYVIMYTMCVCLSLSLSLSIYISLYIYIGAVIAQLARSCSSIRKALSSIPASATTEWVKQKPPP